MNFNLTCRYVVLDQHYVDSKYLIIIEQRDDINHRWVTISRFTWHLCLSLFMTFKMSCRTILFNHFIDIFAYRIPMCDQMCSNKNGNYNSPSAANSNFCLKHELYWCLTVFHWLYLNFLFKQFLVRNSNKSEDFGWRCEGNVQSISVNSKWFRVFTYRIGHDSCIWLFEHFIGHDSWCCHYFLSAKKVF